MDQQHIAGGLEPAPPGQDQRQHADQAAGQQPVDQRSEGEHLADDDGDDGGEEGEGGGAHGVAADEAGEDEDIAPEDRPRRRAGERIGEDAAGGDGGQDEAERGEEDEAEEGGQERYSASAGIMAASARRSLMRMRSDCDFSWPQAARMSRPRGVRMGEA